MSSTAASPAQRPAALSAFTAGVPAAPALVVVLAGTFLATYLAAAAGALGLGRLVSCAVFLCSLVGAPLFWLATARGLGASDGLEAREARLARLALPFLAFVSVGAVTPEFVFGRPGLARIVLVLGMASAIFALLWFHGTGRIGRILAWIERHAGALTVGLVVGHASLTIGLVTLRHAYYTSVLGEDTAYYNQIFWSTLNGEFFRGSLTQARYSNPPVHSEFGAHSSPVLFLLLPAYWAHPSFYTLLIVRNLALSLSAVPLYFLAKARLGSRVAFGVVLVHLLGVNILYQSISAFYPLQFAVLLLPLVFLAFDRARFVPFIGAFALALSVREEIALTAALFSAYALLLRRSWRWVVTPAALAVAWWYVSTHLIMVPSRIAMEDLEEFFRVFPKGYQSAVGVLLGRPVEFVTMMVTSDNVAYLYALLKSSAGIALATPAILFALPTVATNLLVGAFWKTTTAIDMHYSLVASVCLSVALVHGLARLARAHRHFKVGEQALGLALVLALLPVTLLGVKDVVAFGGGRDRTLLSDFTRPVYAETLDRIVQVVDQEPQAAVAAPNVVLPALSHRRDLYHVARLWWYGAPRLDYIVVDTDMARIDQGSGQRARYRAVVEAVQNEPTYRLLLDERGFQLYRVGR